MKIKSLFLVSLLSVAGCATSPPSAGMLHEQEVANSIVYCGNKAECNAMWSRSVRWVQDEGTFHIFKVSDTSIKTMGPDYRDPDHAQDVSFLITESPNPDGSAVIEIRGTCGNEDDVVEQLSQFGNNPPEDTGYKTESVRCHELIFDRADFKMFVRGY